MKPYGALWVQAFELVVAGPSERSGGLLSGRRNPAALNVRTFAESGGLLRAARELSILKLKRAFTEDLFVQEEWLRQAIR